MKIWAISDPHLSFGVLNKNMDVFGSKWKGYTDKIKENWEKQISTNDLILIPGDISWAMEAKEAIPDLEWLHALKGTKVILKGNHDYWWGSLNKAKAILPSSIHLIHNNALYWPGVAIGGTRLWDTSEYNFNEYIDYIPNPKVKIKETQEDQQKIFERELIRLEMSLKELKADAPLRIALTHYPPISADLKDSKASKILEKYQVNICLFGHLHNVKQEAHLFGEKNGVKYILTSCDYLNFNPIQIAEV